MLRWHREDVLNEEGIELHHLPDDHEDGDGHQPHVGGLRVKPPALAPALRRELQQSSFELPFGATDILDALPAVFSHGQELADLHPCEDAQAITEENV